MSFLKGKRELERLQFLADYVTAFTESIHTDISVKPGDGPGIPSHKVVLAAKSKVFYYMLDSDECKTSTESSITIPDLSYEELRVFLEFLYSGILSISAKQHARALYLTAHKYEIPYLQDLCRDQLIESLNLTNVLDILELSSIPSDKLLRIPAITFLVEHMEDIISSDRYISFVRKNPDISVDINTTLMGDQLLKLCISL